MADDNLPEELDDELSEEMQEFLAMVTHQRMVKIDALKQEVVKLRDYAISKRKELGIERQWQEDEEYYLGIDDANRSSHVFTKAAGTTGGLTRDKNTTAGRCSAFFNITGQFTDSAAARMGDILLPANEYNFVIQPTPIADEGLDAETPGPTIDNQTGQLIPGAAPDPQKAELKKRMDQMAAKAERRIQDWMTEGRFHVEFRKVIEDAARVGTGVLKGPVPEFRRAKKYVKNNGISQVIIQEEQVPASYKVDVANCFPDPACGEDIHNGSFFCERAVLSAKQIAEFKGLPGYNGTQIDQVLEEGPQKFLYDEGHTKGGEARTDIKGRYEVWYFYGEVDLDCVTAMKPKLDTEIGSGSGKKVSAIVTMVHDTPIKAVLNPLDTGEFPYDFLPWRQMQGVPYGQGVPRLGRTGQDQVNASGRAMMDNAGLSSRPILIIREKAIRPADGSWVLQAGKVFIATEQADVRAVNDAIVAVNIPSMQAELSAIMDRGYKMMEEATGIFFILQGQQGSAPDTVGGMELLHRNASAILRRFGRLADERLIEPHVLRYYDYLLQYGPEDDEKGDLHVKAVGASSLVEREIQAIETAQILIAAANPIYGLDPEKAMEEMLKVKRLSPDKFKMDEQKKQQLAQQQAPMPQVEVAKINADAKLRVAKVASLTAQRKSEIDMDRDTAYNDSMARRDETNATLRAEELRIKRETAALERDLKMLEYANQRNITLDKVKADLANNTMKLRTTMKLAQMNATADKLPKPPVEPAGRAPKGQSFAK